MFDSIAENTWKATRNSSVDVQEDIWRAQFSNQLYSIRCRDPGRCSPAPNQQPRTFQAQEKQLVVAGLVSCPRILGNLRNHSCSSGP